MPGAVIALDQDRPGPSTSSGSPGISRNDLWVGWAVHPRCTTSGNSSFAWTLLDKPVGSIATVTNSALVACDITCDLPGSYRLQLVTNGGGPGNIKVVTFRVRYDSSGVLTQRGWALPALGESPGESNYGGNGRGYDEPWTYIIEDLLPFIEVLPLRRDLVFFAGVKSTSATEVISSRPVDLSGFPTSIGGKVLSATFDATIVSSAPGVVGQVQLYDLTNSATVAVLDNSTSLTPTIPEDFTSGALTLGPAGGNLRNDVAAQYTIILTMTVGGGLQYVTCYNARLNLFYV